MPPIANVNLPPERFDTYRTYDEALAAYRGEPPLRVIFENGGGKDPGAPEGQWERSFQKWPAPETQLVRYYFHGDGSLNDKAPQEAASGSSFKLDPAAGDRGNTAPGADVFAKLPKYAYKPLVDGKAVAFTSDPLTHSSLPPTMVDLYDTLVHMEGNGPALAQRLRKYTSGTFAGIFSQQSNIDINNQMVVFNIRDLEDELRPVAMYIVLSHIWNVTRSHLKKRMLIVDEAWQLMKYEDSANFLFSLAKRARKYYLGVTTISQDVEDFMASKMGRAIVANSSMQLLLKQSPSAVDVLADVFKLTDEERKRLANFPVGQGLFFAGANHVHVQVVASRTEHQLVTTNPVQQLQQEEQKRMEALATKRDAQAAAPAEAQGPRI